MSNLPNFQATFETVWASLQETDRMLKEQIADADRRKKESDAKFAKSRKDLNRQMAKSRKDFDRQMAKSRENFDRLFKESDVKFEKSREDYDRRMKKLQEQIGGWANNHGSFAEEYFYNAFENGKQNFFGEKFDEIEKNVKGLNKGFRDEYDIVLINEKSIGIIEVKFKAKKEHLFNLIHRKVNTFRVNFPEYSRHQIFLGLASLSFCSELEQECMEQGIAVIKQMGDAVVMNDTSLKVF